MSGYYLASLKTLASTPGFEVHIFVYPVNPVAPFRFEFDIPNLYYYDRASYAEDSLLEKSIAIQPDFILCGGWKDKGYLKVCRYFKSMIPTVLGFDNPWRNTLKQNAASLIYPFYFRKIFNACWVRIPIY